MMAELCLKAEYSDYLAYTCTALKGEAALSKTTFRTP